MINDLEKRVKTDLYGSSDYKPTWVYTLGDDLPQFREVEIASGSEDKTPVTIVQLTDLHFNLMNKQDLEEKNPTLMSTYEKRRWLAGGEDDEQSGGNSGSGSNGDTDNKPSGGTDNTTPPES